MSTNLRWDLASKSIRVWAHERIRSRLVLQSVALSRFGTRPSVVGLPELNIIRRSAKAGQVNGLPAYQQKGFPALALPPDGPIPFEYGRSD